MRPLMPALCLAMLLAGRPAPAAGQAREAAAALRQLPASFAGDLPCADCEGIRYRLNFFPDGAFILGMTYRGKGDGAAFDDIGTWTLSSNQPVLVRVDGRIAMRPKMEGEGLQPTLVPERFIGAYPGESCPPRPAAAPIETASWKLTRLGDAAAATTSLSARPPAR